MPLRDHLRPPLSTRAAWEDLHGQWPAMIVQHLNPVLPEGYMAEPRVHLGPYFEIDVTACRIGLNSWRRPWKMLGKRGPLHADDPW